ncbi:U5 snRNP 100 kD protein [Cryptosporidium ryanae]|uniref:U5 snRNP 100 kD protein n=1 Tax=Cryptosporidium ryanae TaxID=515981 RepID=UPI00351A4580|nr:U5 snRNP 100 kD protein [Cryptosporidium ryanae]
MLRIPGLKRLDRYEEANYPGENGEGLLGVSEKRVEDSGLDSVNCERGEDHVRKRQKNVLKFEWSNSEDTTRFESNDLYKNRLDIDKLQRKKQRRSGDLYMAKEYECRENKTRSLSGDESRSYKRLLGSDNEIFVVDKMELKYDQMTERDWKIFREDNSINVKGLNVVNPIRNWDDCIYIGVNKSLVRNIKYDKPTPIQMQCIPIGISGRDMIGIAETGSGKTVAFLVPLLNYVSKFPRIDHNTSQNGPYGLILAPARELALQIEEEAQKLTSTNVSYSLNIRTLSIVGGRNIEQQAFTLRKGVEIIIATPGRMKDCLEKAFTVLSQCFYLVLDEADRMIDLGFQEPLNYILDQMPPIKNKRVTHMFSATMQKELETIAKKYLNSPINVTIGDIGVGKKSIQQILNFIPENKKKPTLINTLNNKELSTPPIMIFLNQKKMVDIICREITSHGFRAISLHGGKMQETRENNLNQFKSGIYDILVSTDVAGRGIDISNVNLVINYDLPKTIETYTHRIGRTGRAGKNGIAISFVTPEDSGLYSDLKKFLISTNNIVPNELKNI